MTGFFRGVEVQGVHRLDRPGQAATAGDNEAIRVSTRAIELQTQLDNAKARLDEERRTWRQEAEKELGALREKAAHEGHTEGHAQGLIDAREMYEQKLQQAGVLIDRLGGLLAAGLEGSQDLVVAVAYEAVVKVLGAAAATPEGVRAVVAQAISHARQQEKLIVRVPVADYRLLIDDLPATNPLARPGIELRPDPQLAEGGCIIETDAGQLDARLSTQLAALRVVLLQARELVAAGSA